MAAKQKNGNGATTAVDLVSGSSIEKARKAEKDEKARVDRAAENLFRVVHGKHEQLSAMADSKAHIMITICLAVVGVSATQLFDPQLQFAAMTLILTSLLSAGFAIYAIMPSLPAQRVPDPSHPRFNLIFFSDFARLPYETFEQEMEKLILDRRQINRALIHDLYALGSVLGGKKYRYLVYCYRTFLAGLVLSGIALVLSVALLGWS